MARIESVSSVLRQKHSAIGEFRTHISFENRLRGPTLNHLRYGDRPAGFGIDSRIDAATLRAPAASREDSRPQAILKFQPRNSFDCAG